MSAVFFVFRTWVSHFSHLYCVSYIYLVTVLVYYRACDSSITTGNLKCSVVTSMWRLGQLYEILPTTSQYLPCGQGTTRSITTQEPHYITSTSNPSSSLIRCPVISFTHVNAPLSIISYVVDHLDGCQSFCPGHHFGWRYRALPANITL